MMDAEELIDFEDEMAAAFERGEIKAPLHLSKGNEQQLIGIFKNINDADWVCGSWRSHYHCLLKGVPQEELKDAILDGRSIGLCFPKQRVICSAIVGGIMPIALGLAWAIKREGGNNRVWCFIGDMTAHTGIAHEVARYAWAHDLPLEIICEDNGLSVGTVTEDAWGVCEELEHPFKTYFYRLEVPHVGTGKWVSF